MFHAPAALSLALFDSKPQGAAVSGGFVPVRDDALDAVLSATPLPDDVVCMATSPAPEQDDEMVIDLTGDTDDEGADGALGAADAVDATHHPDAAAGPTLGIGRRLTVMPQDAGSIQATNHAFRMRPRVHALTPFYDGICILQDIDAASAPALAFVAVGVVAKHRRSVVVVTSTPRGMQAAWDTMRAAFPETSSLRVTQEGDVLQFRAFIDGGLLPVAFTHNAHETLLSGLVAAGAVPVKAADNHLPLPPEVVHDSFLVKHLGGYFALSLSLSTVFISPNQAAAGMWR